MTFKEKVKIHINDQEKFIKLEKYVGLIEKYNKVMNLTGFSKDRLWKEGIYESILSLEEFVTSGTLLDIGAGAGFPSVPLLIVYPEIELTIYEPIRKRIDFLDKLIKELNLKINLMITRSEESTDFEKFDNITARAVAPLKILIEISYKLSKINGKFIWIKGPKAEEEIRDAKKIISKFKITPEIKNFKIGEKIINIIIYAKKIGTPKGFPRNWSQIIKGNKK